MEVALQNKLEVQVGGRFFIIISRKVGGACERNKLRRRLKAIYFQEGFYRYPWVTIIIGYPGATKYNFAQLKQLVMRHFATLPEAGNAREKEIKSA